VKLVAGTPSHLLAVGVTVRPCADNRWLAIVAVLDLDVAERPHRQRREQLVRGKKWDPDPRDVARLPKPQGTYDRLRSSSGEARLIGHDQAYFERYHDCILLH